MITIKTTMLFAEKKQVRYVDLADCTEVPRRAHQDGAIELSINGVAVLDQDLCDDIDMLWLGIAGMVHKYRLGERAWMGFPDQPVEMSLTPMPRSR